MVQSILNQKMEVTKTVEILANKFGFDLQDGIQALSQVNKTNDIEKGAL